MQILGTMLCMTDHTEKITPYTNNKRKMSIATYQYFIQYNTHYNTEGQTLYKISIYIT